MNFKPMEQLMDSFTSWRMPGNSVSICIENKEVFSYSSGYADIENKAPMTPDKMINIYSCSKVATVTAALQLYEKGLFLLDDPLYDFIPEYREMYVTDSEGNLTKATNPITLRHLFTMTAGLTYNFETEGFKTARELTNGKMDTLTTVKCIAKDPLSFNPGKKWQYSLCHDVLAGVVEVISGKKFRDYVSENIFKPLEMNNSLYHSESVFDKMAEQYRFENSTETDIVKMQSHSSTTSGGKIINIGKANPHILGTEYDSGGAGIITTVSDYSKFSSALANGGTGFNGERILSPGTIELMRENQLSENQRENFIWKQLTGYGYGLGVRTMINKALSGSTGSIKEFGWGGAAGASVLVDPDRKVSMFYAHHMLNPQEEYYQPRIRNVLYTCLDK